MCHCPLCGSNSIEDYCSDKRRAYLQCQFCCLVFVPEHQRLTTQVEKAEYDKHENNPDDPGYRRFLSRLVEPLSQLIPAESAGLDFGCGPGPTLSVMLEELGHYVSLFDIFYYRNHNVWKAQYQFITATEVVEHLHKPGSELDRLWRHLIPGGYLAIMTKLVTDKEAFSRWHYKNDLTHVCFFSRRTFEWLAHKWHVEPHFYGDDVVIFNKPKMC